jgi:hypothetical protein
MDARQKNRILGHTKIISNNCTASSIYRIEVKIWMNQGKRG